MQRSFLSAATRVAPLARAGVPVRQASSVGATAYQLVFRRNITYATFIFGTAVVAELVYGKFTDGLWNTMNSGRTYENTNWAKFKTDDE